MTDTQTIKDRLDIVQLISEYVQLKKSGLNYKACCPFHQEKTPSFMVHPDRQFYHCFGCGKSGDIFTFIQEMEGLDFPEALKLLADRAGIKLDNFRSQIDSSQKNRLLEISQKAAYFFHKFLTDMPAADKARQYLQERQVNQQSVQDWQIGYVPDQWELLTKYLLNKGCGIEDIVSAGLAIKKDKADPASGRGYYDRFRGRIMFPIWDIHDRVVGFTGRVLVETEKSGGKYVNTPQTLIYDKSRVIYGLNKARLEIKKNDLAVLVEGQMDVIACHRAGMKNVVAASGTALTVEQIKMLKRYSDNVAMAFDADEAGVKAAKRGIDIALQQGMNVKIIEIPSGQGKDADECLKKNPQIWFESVAKAKAVMDWYYGLYLGGLDLNDPKAKQQAGENFLAQIAHLPFAIEREHWLKKLSDSLKVDVAVLKNELKRLNARNFGQPANRASGRPMVEEFSPTPVVHNRYLSDLENIWAVLIKQPALWPKFNEQIKPEYFIDTYLSAVYEKAKEQYNNSSILDVGKLANETDLDLRQKIDILMLRSEQYYGDLSDKDFVRELSSIIKRVANEHQKRQIFKLINT